MKGKRILITFLLLVISNFATAKVLKFDNLSIKIPNEWKSRSKFTRGVQFISRSPTIGKEKSRVIFMISKVKEKIKKIDLKKAQAYQNIFKAQWQGRQGVSSLDFDRLDYRKINDNHVFSMHTVKYKFENRQFKAKTFIVKCYDESYSFEVVGKAVLNVYIEQAEKFIREMSCKS